MAASAETDLTPNGWSVLEGAYNSTEQPFIGARLTAIEEMADGRSEEAAARIRAVYSVLYAAELVSPDRFINTDEAEDIESDVIRAAQLCANYSFHTLTEGLREKTPALDTAQPAIVDAIETMFSDDLISRDTRILSEGIIRVLYLKQAGREADIPAAYLDRPMKWKR